MKHCRILAAVLLYVLAAALVPACGTGESYRLSVRVDAGAPPRPISPMIYGINQYGNEEAFSTLRVNAVRQGGNRMTAYNWENNASNAGSDWQHSSDSHLSSSWDPADCARVLSGLCAQYGIPYKMTTLQLAGYVSADKQGTVPETKAAPSERWKEVLFTGGNYGDEPDRTDGVVYLDEYVRYLVRILGSAETAAGIQGYSLDNEPALWNHTHPRVHPDPVGIAELAEKSIAAAKAVKSVDPAAEIFGPALYGYTAYDHLADDDSHSEWETIKASQKYHWYLDCYLDQMRQAEDEAGIRLLDVLDIHYYSESARVSSEDRVQSIRTLYEKGFRENSWIGQWCQENIPLLPTIRKSIDKWYPGTKLAITEYNFGGENDISGTIAEAEALACFAEQGIYLAALWGGGNYIWAGIRLYTDYDGKGSAFGSLLIPSESEDVSKTAACASVNAESPSTITVMLTNKDAAAEEKLSLILENAGTSYSHAEAYGIWDGSPEIRRLTDIRFMGYNELELILPPWSVAMVVIHE